MKSHVLLIEPMMPEVEAQLDAAYCVHRLFAAYDRAALIAAIGSSVRAIVTGGAHGASNEIVDALPQLEIIVINGIGTDAVDLERARARSVRVTTTPDVLTEDVADLALGLMLATSRRICVADHFVRSGGWLHKHLSLAAKVSGKRLGIFGLGHVGRAVARRAEGFGIQIAYCDRDPVADAAYRFQPDLEQLAKDFGFSGNRGERRSGDARSRHPARVGRTRPRRHPDQCRARQRRRRARAGCRARRRASGWGGPGRICARARGSKGALGHGQCRAPAASGERDGRDAPGHG